MKATALERTLLVRLQNQSRRSHTCARDWDGSTYGYGAGRAHPSVEFVACPHCLAAAGRLCRGAWQQPIFGSHYSRRRAFKDLKKKVLQQS